MDSSESNNLTYDNRIYTLYIFEWDNAKAETNIRKHGISFEESQDVFYDEHALIIPDEEHSDTEDRFIMLGLSFKANVLVVCFCERGEDGNVIRIISSRKANKQEAAQYWTRRTK